MDTLYAAVGHGRRTKHLCAINSSHPLWGRSFSMGSVTSLTYVGISTACFRSSSLTPSAYSPIPPRVCLFMLIFSWIIPASSTARTTPRRTHFLHAQNMALRDTAQLLRADWTSFAHAHTFRPARLGHSGTYLSDQQATWRDGEQTSNRRRRLRRIINLAGTLRCLASAGQLLSFSIRGTTPYSPPVARHDIMLATVRPCAWRFLPSPRLHQFALTLVDIR